MIRRHTDMNSEAMKQQTKTTKDDDQFTMIYNDLHVCIYVCIDRETRNAYQPNASPLRQSTLQDQWYNGRRAFERRLKGLRGTGKHW